MADYRQIHTCIWKDSWFIELPQEFKLLFIYLFSNERANLTGLYDLSLRVIEFEAGLDMETIEAGLERFAKDGRVFYEDGMVWIPTLLRHNARNVTSPKIQTHIKGIISTTRDCPLKTRWVEYYNASLPEAYRMDTVWIPEPEGGEEHVPAPVPAPVLALARVPSGSPSDKHPAISLYERVTDRSVPNDSWRERIQETVGLDPPALQLWESVLDSWVGHGWNPANVQGLLDVFEKGGIDERGERGNGSGRREPMPTKESIKRSYGRYAVNLQPEEQPP